MIPWPKHVIPPPGYLFGIKEYSTSPSPARGLFELFLRVTAGIFQIFQPPQGTNIPKRISRITCLGQYIWYTAPYVHCTYGVVYIWCTHHMYSRKVFSNAVGKFFRRRDIWYIIPHGIGGGHMELEVYSRDSICPPPIPCGIMSISST